MATKQALQAIKKFRKHELNQFHGLKRPSQPLEIHNPFLPFKNPESGRWRPPKYSLRRQAELVKKAKASNTLTLLPAGPKLPPSVLAAARKNTELKQERWSRDLVWTGEVKEKTVRGLNVGYLNRVYLGRKKFFKGHKWERVKEKRMKKRKILMRDMKKRIVQYKTVSSRSWFMLLSFTFLSLSLGSITTRDDRNLLDLRYPGRPQSCLSDGIRTTQRYYHTAIDRLSCTIILISTISDFLIAGIQLTPSARRHLRINSPNNCGSDHSRHCVSTIAILFYGQRYHLYYLDLW